MNLEVSKELYSIITTHTKWADVGSPSLRYRMAKRNQKFPYVNFKVSLPEAIGMVRIGTVLFDVWTKGSNNEQNENILQALKEITADLYFSVPDGVVEAARLRVIEENEIDTDDEEVWRKELRCSIRLYDKKTAAAVLART